MKRLGPLSVNRIGREDVLAVLTPIWTAKPETARRVRRHIRATLKWCQAHGYVEFNAAGEAIDGALPSMPAEARLWRIPGQRMKSGTEHRVPLSMPAFDVLERAEALDDGSGLVFPSSFRRGRKMSNMTLTKVLRDTGLAKRSTVHGFRSSFRDWCADTGKPREVAEAALAHTVGGVEGAYFRSDLFQRRRQLMDSWAAYLTGADAKVGPRGKRSVYEGLEGAMRTIFSLPVRALQGGC